MDRTKVHADQNRKNCFLTTEEAKLESSEAKSSSQGAIDYNSFSVPAKPG